jgi:hypothetical protein
MRLLPGSSTVVQSLRPFCQVLINAAIGQMDRSKVRVGLSGEPGKRNGRLTWSSFQDSSGTKIREE